MLQSEMGVCESGGASGGAAVAHGARRRGRDRAHEDTDTWVILFMSLFWLCLPC